MKIFLAIAAASAALYPALDSVAEAQDVAPAQTEIAADADPVTDPIMVSRPVVQPLPEPEEDSFSAYEASEDEIDCLVSAVHFEARGEPVEGRVAVVEVVLARRESNRWPSTACGVIAQRSQFSFVRNGRIPDVSSSHYDRAREVVMDVLSGRTSSSAKGATYFHASYVRPGWSRSKRQISQIGRHLFYGA